MAQKSRTIKVVGINPDELERLKVDPTQAIDPSKLDLFSGSFEDKIVGLSYDELKYKLDFELTDSNERRIAKDRLKTLKTSK